MQAEQEAEAADRAVLQEGGGVGAAEAARAEFRDTFVSLVDPAGLLYMDRCAEAAGRMEDAASKAGYGAGARMAAALAGIFADTDRIVSGQVDDTTLHCTHLAFRNMMGVLYDTARAYRGGESPEPVARLEEAREAAARLRAEVDAHIEEIGRPGSPGPVLTGLDMKYRGMVCRYVIREYQAGVREEIKSRGFDPIFPPKLESIDECFGEYDGLNMSSADMIALSRGRIPDGYKLVRIEDGVECRW